MKLFSFMLTLLIALSGSAVAASLTIQVEANRTKINDAPWDGVVGTGAGKGALFFGVPASGPPDLAICVITLNKEKQCFLKRDAKNIYSLCQNSYECDFHDIDIGDAAFGLIIIDLDKVQQDFVDAVILVDGDAVESTDFEGLEQKVRAETSKLSPPLTEGERERRERPLQRFEVSQCAGDRECALRQSVLRISE